MDYLQVLLSILDELRKKNEIYNSSLLTDGHSCEYSFGFLLGEYNLRCPSIIKAMEIIKNQRQRELVKYISLSLNFHFQGEILNSKQKIDEINNEIRCAKQNPKWKENCYIYYDCLLETESNIINESKEMLKKTKLDDFFNFFTSKVVQSNSFENLANWIVCKDFFQNNYGYYSVLETVYNYYCFEYINLKDFNAKENILFTYFKNSSYTLNNDLNFMKFGLITLTNDYEPICTDHLECRIFNTKLNITLSLTRLLDNTLFKEFISLYHSGIIKQISFKPQYAEPFEGKFISDMALEALQFGKIFDVKIENLVPTKLTTLKTDSLWINPVGNEITFEEIQYDFKTFDEFIVTQVVHFSYFEEENSFYIDHMDHELIFYTFKEYDRRSDNIREKGTVKKRQKTFKIDNSKIPFIINGKPEFLIKVLYTYFSEKELLDEYFSQY